MSDFELKSKYDLTLPQKKCVESLCNSINIDKFQTLLGVTGCGKTFIMANVIKNLNKSALIIAHNKTLANQLYLEFKEYFPNNEVLYFISYYDFYLPEIYIPKADKYYEKDSKINEEIEVMRHRATESLCQNDKVIVIATVSCIYGLGQPVLYEKSAIDLRLSDKVSLEKLIENLVDISYVRINTNLNKSTFRVRGDIIEIKPISYDEKAIRVEFFDDVIEKIAIFDTISGNTIEEVESVKIFPATHYLIEKENLVSCINKIREEKDNQKDFFLKQGKELEAERLEQRVEFDIENIKLTGNCIGIENYKKYLHKQDKSLIPETLMDYFEDDFITFVDESHITLPQINAMLRGDMKRKQNLIDYGFRLPSSLENRCLSFSEFIDKTNNLIFVSATPSKIESEYSQKITELLLRPTGLLDPIITVVSKFEYEKDLIDKVKKEIDDFGKALILTTTKKESERLTSLFVENDVRVRYIHSDIKTLDRVDIINNFRKGEFDVLIGINLLREGLDLPEVTMIAILDADKKTFLRTTISLIQIIGRVSRNVNGKVFMYADEITDNMQIAIDETKRRRKLQKLYNKQNNITPTTIIKPIFENKKLAKSKGQIILDNKARKAEKVDLIKELTYQMNEATKKLEFEEAIVLRDKLYLLKNSNNLNELR